MGSRLLMLLLGCYIIYKSLKSVLHHIVTLQYYKIRGMYQMQYLNVLLNIFQGSERWGSQRIIIYFYLLHVFPISRKVAVELCWFKSKLTLTLLKIHRVESACCYDIYFEVSRTHPPAEKFILGI